MDPARSLARHRRVFRTLLLVYPRAFRQLYGADMVQVFGDRLAETRRRRKRTSGLWIRTFIDLVKTAPVQRLEVPMSREAAYVVMFVLALVTLVTGMALGLPVPVALIALAVLVSTGIVLLATGAFGKERARNAAPGGRVGLGQWWLVPAVVLGLAELALAIGQLVSDPKVENIVALVILAASASAVAIGIWLRTRSRSSGDLLIALGVLPSAALFWHPVPPILAGVVIVAAIIDSLRAAKSPVSA